MPIQISPKIILWSDIWNVSYIELRIWKSQDFNGVWTRDLAIPVRRSNQLSYGATDAVPHRLIRTHKWPAPNLSGFIAQLVRASHRYREVTGSNPIKSWLFQASIRNCLNCVHNCEDHSSLEKLYWLHLTSKVHVKPHLKLKFWVVWENYNQKWITLEESGANPFPEDLTARAKSPK